MIQNPDFDKGAYVEAIDREVRFARVLGSPIFVTWWLLVINVVFFFAAYFYGIFVVSQQGFGSEYYQPLQLAFYPGMKVNVHIASGEWWRLISSMFVHLNIAHIGFNGYGLFVLGPLVEKFFGARRFFTIYMFSGLVAALASYLFNDVPSGGASGAIYGLVGALAVFGVRYRSELPDRVAKTFTTGMLPWVVIGIGIGFIPSIPFDNAAHIGGLIAGGVAAALMPSRMSPASSKARWWAATVVAVAFLLACVWALDQWTAETIACLPERAAFLECYPEINDRI